MSICIFNEGVILKEEKVLGMSKNTICHWDHDPGKPDGASTPPLQTLGGGTELRNATAPHIHSAPENPFLCRVVRKDKKNTEKGKYGLTKWPN